MEALVNDLTGGFAPELARVRGWAARRRKEIEGQREAAKRRAARKRRGFSPAHSQILASITAAIMHSAGLSPFPAPILAFIRDLAFALRERAPRLTAVY